MTREVSRRTVLKAGAVAGVSVLGVGSVRAQTGAGVDLQPSAGWDYPAAVGLLPFGHGVASGDPLADRVILWTRITVPDPRGWNVADPQGLSSIEVDWEVATDPMMRNPVAAGHVTTTRDVDWTVKVDASGLRSATTHFFRFTALGVHSPVGRTRTAPALGDPVPELRFAHSACTSWWSTDFHFYRRIAERNDVDLFLHAGDHVYEFVDNSQWYRARNNRFDTQYVDFAEWTNADECRRRYALYYSDPGLLAAHQAMAWCVIIDNHDLDDHEENGEVVFSRAQAAEVFWEWTPCRPPRADGSGAFDSAPAPDRQVPVPRGQAAERFYRVLPWGDLADVICLDIRTFRSAPSADSALGGSPPLGSPVDPAVDDLLGPTQEAWLTQTLLASKDRGAAFRVLVNSVNMSQVKASVPLQTQLADLGVETGTSGSVYPNGWDQWPASRTRLFRFLRDNDLVDNIVMTGDAHGWFASDLVEDNQAPNYLAATGGGLLGAVGVELQPGGGGRVNLQGTVAREAYAAVNGHTVEADYQNYRTNFYPAALPAARAVEGLARAGNPNLLYLNWRTYGYGISHVTAANAFIELWEVPLPEPTDAQALIAQFRTDVGAPHLNPVDPPVATKGVRIDAPTPALAITLAAARPVADNTPRQLPTTGPVSKVLVGLGVLAGALAITARRLRDRLTRAAD